MVANELFLNTPEKAIDWLRENGNEICNRAYVIRGRDKLRSEPILSNSYTGPRFS